MTGQLDVLLRATMAVDAAYLEARLTREAEQLAARERADILAAKAEGAVLPHHHWQARWRAEEKARAARLLVEALEFAP